MDIVLMELSDSLCNRGRITGSRTFALSRGNFRIADNTPTVQTRGSRSN